MLYPRVTDAVPARRSECRLEGKAKNAVHEFFVCGAHIAQKSGVHRHRALTIALGMGALARRFLALPARCRCARCPIAIQDNW